MRAHRRTRESEAVSVRRSGWSLAANLAAVTVGYYAASRVGLVFAIPPADVTPVWPASGIALAAVLRLGWVACPGIWLAATITALESRNPLWVAAALAIGNALEALLAAYLVRWAVRDVHPLDRGWDAVKFWALGGWVSCAIGAALGVAPLSIAGLIPRSALWDQWWAWWLGDVGGVVLVTPILLTWNRAGGVRWTAARIAEAACLLVSLVVVSGVVFGGWVSEAISHPLPYLILPLLVWTAFRFSQRETALLMGGVAGLALWDTAHGLGPFRGASASDALILLQSFINVTAVTGLAMTAVVGEHRASKEALRRSRDELDQRVRERTADLVQANAALQTEVEERSRMADERERILHDLQTALVNVKTLTGLLPICASCKRIRNDQGYWDQVETYITKHSDARFSHGTCPECARRLYPECFSSDADPDDA